MWRWAVLIFLALSGCSHYKTRQDCFEICRAHGLRFVEVVSGPQTEDAWDRNAKTVDACRCE